MDKEKFRELCSSYFLNDISSEEYSELKQALASGEPEYLEIYLKVKCLFLYLPMSAQMVEPPSGLKGRILNEIKGKDIYQAGKLSDKLASFFGLNKPFVAFAALVILFTAIIALSFYLSEMIQKVKTQETEIVELKDELEKNEEILAVLQAKRIEVVFMDGLKVNPAGYGKIIWNPEKKSAILQISNLPLINEDKDYQLWVIRDNIPISAGVFDVTKGADNFFKIENLAEANKQYINAFAVTLEPKGGVPQPTGEMYLLGKPILQ